MKAAFKHRWVGIGIFVVVSTFGLQAQAKGTENTEAGLDAHLHVLAQKITGPLGGKDKPYTGVMDFIHLNGCLSDLGRYVAEKLLQELVATNRLKVLERTLRRQTLEELALAVKMKDLSDPEQAQQFGKQLAAEVVVSGTITDGGEDIKINARVIHVATGHIVAAAGSEISKDSFVSRLLEQSQICPKDMSLTKKPEPKAGVPETVVKEKFSQEFSSFRVRVTRLRVGSKQITLLVTYKNKTEEPLFIALDTPRGNRTMNFMGTVPPQMKKVGPGKSYLLDTRGNRYDFMQASGISGGWYGSYSFLGASGYLWEDGTTFLGIPPNEERSVTIQFRSSRGRGAMRKEKFDFFSGQLVVEQKKNRHGRTTMTPVGTFTLSILDIDTLPKEG